ncbi:Probable Co/Zn/Cd efflux system membrane fusion protein [hydrothermal vent metagenome]|uniref:Probable Co/Zn/Cd efflux system membrane fusion protein n=1 Tax=hydrothermal vent metagenome TaxID=652676 RepID=A0A3B1CLC3_9ZZZZ
MAVKIKKVFITVGVLALLLFAGILWFALRGNGNPASTSSGITAGKGGEGGSTKAERKIKYWQGPMNPSYISDKPGKSPMGMELIPVYEDEAEDEAEGVIKINPVTVQDMGVRTRKVTKRPFSATIRTVGYITYDEELVKDVNTKISGWVEKLYVDTTGEDVREGQKLLSIYSPALVATQEEYLQALRFKEKTSDSAFVNVVKGADTLLESTRKRLLLMDIDPGQVKVLEERGEVQKSMILHSPATGTVIKKPVFEGMRVNPGMKLYTIANLSRVWVQVSFYEYELPFLKVGQEAEMTLPYEPGVTYKGRITFIYPYLSKKTRTVQARMEFENPGLKLKPDMYANIVLKSKISSDAILVPSEAVIRTGVRNIVITSLGGGKFLPREVKLGAEAEGFVQVLSGLKEGDIAVVSGQFLIDSESNLREAINKMLAIKKASQKMDMKKKDAGAETNKKNGGSRKAPQKMDMEMKKEDAGPGAKNDGGKSRKAAMLHSEMSKEQKNLMTEAVDDYIDIHKALVEESPAAVVKGARSLSGTVGKIKALTDPEGNLQEFTRPIEDSIDGLLSGDIVKERDSFAALSGVMASYIRGAGRTSALSAGIKLYFCPMKEEFWLQKAADVQNPYLGKNMLVCGNEEKY